MTSALSFIVAQIPPSFVLALPFLCIPPYFIVLPNCTVDQVVSFLLSWPLVSSCISLFFKNTVFNTSALPPSAPTHRHTLSDHHSIPSTAAQLVANCPPPSLSTSSDVEPAELKVGDGL